MPEWIAASADRLDVFLSNQEEDLSRSRAQKLIREGKVKVNRKIVKKPAHILHKGDGVLLERSVEEEYSSPTDLSVLSEEEYSSSTDLPILYEDPSCLVINKPAGIAVHPGNGMGKDEKTILHGIAHLFEERSLLFSSEATLVHRLDKETTGCLLIAKNPKAHATLQKQFEGRTVQKSYLALVAGVPSPPAAIIDAPIGRNLTEQTKMSLYKTRKSREAQTMYRILSTPVGEEYSSPTGVALLLCSPHTGRTHQIRVHLAAIGHPILGDKTYGSSSSTECSKLYGIGTLCLHAWKLSFTSPHDKKIHSVTAPIPPPLLETLEKLALFPLPTGEG